MKIIDNRVNKCKFNEIKVGDYFMFLGNLCIKISDINPTNTCILDCGGLTATKEYTIVEKVNVIIHIENV